MAEFVKDFNLIGKLAVFGRVALNLDGDLFGEFGAVLFGVDSENADVDLAEGTFADMVGEEVLLAADGAAGGE